MKKLFVLLAALAVLCPQLFAQNKTDTLQTFAASRAKIESLKKDLANDPDLKKKKEEFAALLNKIAEASKGTDFSRKRKYGYKYIGSENVANLYKEYLKNYDNYQKIQNKEFKEVFGPVDTVSQAAKDFEEMSKEDKFFKVIDVSVVDNYKTTESVGMLAPGTYCFSRWKTYTFTYVYNLRIESKSYNGQDRCWDWHNY